MKKQNQIVFYFTKIIDRDGETSFNLTTNRKTPSMYLGSSAIADAVGSFKKQIVDSIMDCLLRMNLDMQDLQDVKFAFNQEYKFECKVRKIRNVVFNLKFGQYHVPIEPKEIRIISLILYSLMGEFKK